MTETIAFEAYCRFDEVVKLINESTLSPTMKAALLELVNEVNAGPTPTPQDYEMSFARKWYPAVVVQVKNCVESSGRLFRTIEVHQTMRTDEDFDENERIRRRKYAAVEAYKKAHPVTEDMAVGE